MKFYIFIVLLVAIYGCSTQTTVNAASNSPLLSVTSQSTLSKSSWIHGAANCDTDQNPAIDVYKHDEQSFIIRQNKCLNFEAPFIYVLVGKLKILVLDTGALGGNATFSLYTELANILGKEQLASKKVLVVHSHSHGDHYQGDSHFDGQPNVTLIKTSATEVKQFLGFKQWPQGQKTIELGGRKITIMATPGHQEEAISIYDEQTKWLLTGDTLYPGYIYVKNWQKYRSSIARLTTFAHNNEVIAILGAHIEMKSQPGLYYAIGSTYQPNEAKLDLRVESLQRLNTQLNKTDQPDEIIFADFIIKPMSYFQKTLSNIARWLKQ